MLYSNEDFENFYVRYKAEGLPRNMTVKAFCIHNKVPWNLFDKWYRDTRHRIAPVTISGRPEENDAKDCEPERTEEKPKASSVSYPDKQSEEKEGKEPVRIMVDIRISNGMQIRQRDIDYGRLKLLVEKLEVLC